MTYDEWRERYAQQIVNVTQMARADALECAQLVDEATIDDNFDDPEGCADDEMSCWTDDGDDA